MRRLFPWFALALLLVPALQPYLAGDFPRTNDAAPHLYRAFELARLIRAGEFFLRWGPDFAHGYGYPTFHYFPYLSHYLIATLHLAGLPLLWAMRVAFALALVGSAVAACLLARDLFDGSEAAGLVAATGYVYSPYLLYTANVRGGLPESVMLALLPLALLALRRLGRGEWRWLPVGALAVAGMTFSHLGGLVQASPFVGLFAVISLRSSVSSFQSSVFSRRPASPHASRLTPYVLRFTFYASRLTHSLLPFAALLLGLALPAFQWLPARAELGAVRFAEGFGRAGIVYSLNFARVADLFALPRLPVDLDLLNPPVVRPLPLVAVALALVGLVRWRAFAPPARRYVLFFGFVLFASVFLSLDVSRFAWDRISLLQQTVWPWRYLAPAALAAALLAGAAVGSGQSSVGSRQSPVISRQPPVISHQSSVSSPQPPSTRSASRSTPPQLRITNYVLRITHHALRILQHLASSPTIILPVLLLTSLPWLYPPREALPAAPTLADLARAEIPPTLVGTTTTGEYTPIWVQTWPNTSAMRQEQAAGREPERLDAASLPPGSAFTVTVRNPRLTTYLLDLPSAATVVYRTFYFPGWEAALDGWPVEVRPTQPEGLIAFDVPAGSHIVALRFGDTPVRRLAGAISLAALGALAVSLLLAVGSRQWAVVSNRLSVIGNWILVIGRQQPVIGRQGSVAKRPARNYQLPITIYVSRFTPYALLLLVKLLLLDTGLTPLVRHGLREGGLAGVAHPLGIDFGGELTLLGYDLSSEAIGGGETSTLNLYWRAQRPLGVPYGLSARLVDERGLAWSSPDIRRPRDFRFFPGTDNWPAGQYILDPYVVTPILGAPPGVYDLEVIAYRQADLQAIGSARIGQMTITTPARGEVDQAPPETSFGNGVALLAHSLDRAAAAPGDQVLIALRWRAESQPGADHRARLELAASATGEAALAHEFVIVEGYPTGRWQAGDVLADQILVRLPAGLETDAYTWQLAILGADGSPAGGPAPLAANPASGELAFQVTAPLRSFDLPEVARPVDVALGGEARLWGYNLSAEAARPGDTVAVSLVWQALREMPVSYNVFLHLTDPAGEAIVAQSDGEPANWTRPTTGWVAGEVVVDDRLLRLPADLPAGEYSLWAGMVDPATQERLPAPDAPDGRVWLGSLVVE